MVHSGGVPGPAGEMDPGTNNPLQATGAVGEAGMGLCMFKLRRCILPAQEEGRVMLTRSMVFSPKQEKQLAHNIKAERTKTVLPPAVY